ncbi:hypothetical protein BHE74_00002117 [Ensete ventricosum]|nr:hypothetical protein GW17_00013186 [Ensete ventricosum]RWW88981.1 hypothetical protein BHE74_00002117 [Ensete ventricosum]RZR80716.1 hypothetical protein BHM03_00006780 [Ensete ventricosum]
MRVTVCLSINQGELLREHRCVEASGRKGRGSDDEFSGAQLPKSKASIRNEMDSEVYHSTVEVDLPMARKGYRCEAIDSRVMSLVVPWYRKGGTSVELSIPCSYRGRALVVKRVKEVENAEANSKYKDRAEAKELHKTGVDGLLIKIAESEGLPYGRSEFDYSTTAVESSWEPRGMLQLEQKIEDSTKGKEMQRLQ